MFEHLDDPQPYTPPPGLRSGVLTRVRRRRRRQVAVAGGVATVAAVAAGSVVAVRDRLEPERIEVGGLAAEPDGGSGPGEGVPGDGGVEPGDPVTFLVVGTDRGAFTEQGRADTIGLVRLDPEAGEVRLLTVPRDLLLPLTGGGEERAAQVFAGSGPTGLVDGIRDELGVEVDHYVEVDFAGAVELVDAIGGIRVAVDRPLRDDDAGLVLGAGCQELDGATALALGRSRKGEVQQPDGSWTSDTSAVFGRDARGAAVAAALVQAVGRAGLDDLPGLVAAGLDSVTVDADLATDDLEGWARDAADDRFVPLGLPVADSGDGATLRLDEGAADVVAALIDGGTEPVPALVDGAPLPEPTGLRPC